MDKFTSLRSADASGLEDLKNRDSEAATVIDLPEDEQAKLERRVWRKLDIWVLPLATMFYLLSFLDRANIANANVAGMGTELRMSSYDYSLALTITYIPYILTEIPSNLVLRVVGPDLMLPGMVVAWGLVATMQGVVTSYGGLLACRFFLGLTEGGLLPGMTLYLASLYPREKLQTRIATFFASASLSGAFSGLIAAAISNMDGVGGRPGWAWIFILEGLFTVVFGVVCFFLLPKSPETARFLAPTERSYIIRRLREGGTASKDDSDNKVNWKEIITTIKAPNVWIMFIIGIMIGTMLYGIAYFEPIIVQGLGYTGNRAQLMSAPPFAAAFVMSLSSALISDRYGRRGLMTIFFSVWSVIGYSIYLCSTSRHAQYGALFLTVPGTYSACPAIIAWMANNSAPHARRATAVALSFIASNSGGVLATWLFGPLSPAPEYRTATIVCIAFSAGTAVLAGVNWAYLSRENRRKVERRREMRMLRQKEGEGEEKGLGDRSVWFVYNL